MIHAFKDVSIKYKLVVIITLTSCIALLIASSGFIANELFTFRRSMIEKLTTQAKIVGGNSVSALAFNYAESAEETLAELRAEPHISLASIHTPDGKLFAKYISNQDSLLHKKCKHYSDNYSQKSSKSFKEGHHFGDDHLDLFLWIVHEGDTVGTVYLQSDLDELHSNLRRNVSICAIVLLISSLVALLLSSKFQQLISKPILDLTQTMKIVSEEKKYSIRVEKQRKDELGALNSGFNEMLAQIQLRDKKLEQHSEQLEKQVAMRTAELSEANQHLKQTVADLKEAKEAAEEASRLKTQFVNNISHEIRTPLNAIIGFSEIILRANSLETIHGQSQVILRESDHLLSLINKLLDQGKMEAGKLELELQPLDLYQLVEQIVSSVHVQAQAKGLEFHTSIEETAPRYIRGDVLRLRQILLNLASNSIKFTKNGSVTVLVKLLETKKEFVTLHFSVIDTGIGIPKEKQEAIFQRFTQVDGSMTRKYGGTGLGTTISRQLVELMGGEIGLESELGQGSTFWFKVTFDQCLTPPELSELAVIPEGNLSLLDEGNGRSCYILLAEDYPPNQDVARIHLEGAGYTLKIVDNGKQAVAACGEQKFDLILMDIQMPEMDGIEATRCIRSGNSPCVSVPILAMTAHADAASRKVCLAAGMNDVITKPIRRQSLLITINKWFSQNDVDIQANSNVESSSGEKMVYQKENMPINYNEAINEFAGNKDVLDAVLNKFIAEVELQNQILEKAINERDAEILRKEAHKIYGGAAGLTAMQLADIADQLEVLGKSGNLKGGERLVSEFKEEFKRLKEFVLNN